MPAPPLGLNMVLRLFADGAGSVCLVAAGGGGTEKRARSCSSVSRIRLVISWFCSNALVKIFGGANLGRVQSGGVVKGRRTYGSSAIDAEHSEICSRWASRSVMVCNASTSGHAGATRGVNNGWRALGAR